VYRHIVLDQLRDMGGTRFFVSVNSRFIELETIPQNTLTRQVKDSLLKSLTFQLGQATDPRLDFVDFRNLKVLSRANLMVDLPPKWQRFALIDPGDQSPVVVVQLPISENEWLYLATVFPQGAIINHSLLSTERMLSLALVSFTVLILTMLLVRWIVGPLRLLSKQAHALGRGQNPDYINEQGTSEMVSTIRAFNQMSQRIHKFISERERFFASISHDLKTPLTRARLRVELLDDSESRDLIIKDLENLDALIKAALQMMKEGEIHENTVKVDLYKVLTRCLDSACVVDIPSKLDAPNPFPMLGRPLSLERLFTNLVDNAIHYGRSVEVIGWIDEALDCQIVQVCDHGPGLSNSLKEKVFQPFFRVGKQPTAVHAGLGMGIVQNIVQLHGGSIELKDREGGGLIVEVRFPLSQFDTQRDVATDSAR
jgi:signal transduction histidine kinase